MAAMRPPEQGMKPTQPLHGAVVKRLLGYFEMGTRDSKDRRSIYAMADNLFTSYVDPDDIDSSGKLKNPYERTLVLPFSQACVETLASYLHSAMTARTPWVPLMTYDPDLVRSVPLLESVLHSFHTENNCDLRLFGWVLDALKYGRGVMQAYWDAEQEPVVAEYQVPIPGMFGVTGATTIARRTEWQVKREAEMWENIDIRNWIQDPRCPGWDLQRGEFVACEAFYHWYEVEKLRATGEWFNVDEIPKDLSPQMETRAGSGRTRYSVSYDNQLEGDRSPVFALSFFVRLIPALWPSKTVPIGQSYREETWEFCLVNGQTICRARPIDNRHDRFPFATMDAHFDAHAAWQPGDLEQTEALNSHASFLYNARRMNVLSSVLNAIVFDPRYISTTDIMQPYPGMRVRLLQALDRPISSVLHQMQTQDVTASYLSDIGMIGTLLKDVTGAVDTIRGQLAKGTVTATEIDAATSAAQARAASRGNRMWLQGIRPIVDIEIEDVQQFMSQERYVQIAAEGRTGQNRLLLSPGMLQGSFLVAPMDLTQPVTRDRQGEVLLKLAELVGTNPLLQMQYDVTQIIEEAFFALGVKNIDDFKVQVQPTADVLGQAEAGNLIPTPASATPEIAAAQALMQAAAGMGGGR